MPKSLLLLIAGAVISLLIYFVNPLALQPNAQKVLAVAVLMIFWWISEALPLAVVAFVPLIIFPLLNVAKIDEVAVAYSNPVIFLFMGGFFIGLALEKWNLHKRIALSIVNKTGTSGNRIILGFIMATGFISMWLSNTATTMMMFPIATSVVAVMKNDGANEKGFRYFSLALMLSIAYASNFGGIATIIGTPPNVAFVSYISKAYNYEIPFSKWLYLCMPLSIIILLSLYFVLVKWLYPNNIKSNVETKNFLLHELKTMGKLDKAESRVLAVFCATALMWIIKDLINKNGFFKLDDNIIALIGATLLFMIPSGNKTEPNEKLLAWGDTKKMAWGILLLFGGGIALANSLENVGLIKMLGEWIGSFSGSGGFMLVLVITLVSLFISEVMSNIAQVIVLAPVIGALANQLHINPLLLGIPMTLAASCASMLPMGTPPNAIAFSSGHIKLKDMIKAGFVMNLFCVILITLFSWFLLPHLLNNPIELIGGK